MKETKLRGNSRWHQIYPARIYVTRIKLHSVVRFQHSTWSTDLSVHYRYSTEAALPEGTTDLQVGTVSSHNTETNKINSIK